MDILPCDLKSYFNCGVVHETIVFVLLHLINC